MPNLSSLNSGLVRALALALLVLLSSVAEAKPPLLRAAFENSPRSITPKPKEWAMDDDPIAPPPPPRAGAPVGAPGQPARTTNAAPGTATIERATDTASLESVPVASAVTHPQRQLPYFWLMVTALMSFGALAMCATFIMRENAPRIDDVPIVPDALEVTA